MGQPQHARQHARQRESWLGVEAISFTFVVSPRNRRTIAGKLKRRLHANVPGARDGTAYHRHGPRTLVTHYRQRLASAAVREDACATAEGIRAVLSHTARTATD